MKVAFDAAPLLDPPTGIGRYVRELGDALEDQGVDVKRYAVSFTGVNRDRIARWRVPAMIAQASWRRFGKPSIRRLVGDVDVLHATNFVLPPLPGVPAVVTVHDLGFFRSDVFPGGERLRDLVPWSIQRASMVLVPSVAIQVELTELMDVDADRVVVTPEGVSQIFFGATPLAPGALARLGIRPPFVLAAGTLQPRKNLARLLAAWSAVSAEFSEWTLVLAGPRGWGPNLPETPRVVLPGWVGDETLPGLLAAADIFCYPSLYEGFGLPPLEAMAAGTSVLAGRYSAAEEVLGDAALLVDPTDVDALAQGLVHLATDDRARVRMARAGKARAASYSWEKAATLTAAAYRRCVEVVPHR
ncbi:MAG: glycosyltransferase family 4 protein [Actinomycetota bacterium]